MIVAMVFFAAGYLIRGGGAAKSRQGGAGAKGGGDEILFWTCSMDPQVKQPGPGKCPICGMDLIPKKKGIELGERQVMLSPRGLKLAEVETALVERKFVTTEIRMVGKIEFDETRLGYITAWVPGRLDRLYVDYTGIPVKKGDHMASLYSPDLYAAQEELSQALKAYNDLENTAAAGVKESAKETVEAAREKLRLWGLPPEQIAMIEKSGKPSDHLTIYSPMGGIVIHKHAVEGMYVKTGMKIYTIADLNHVWAKLDAYESDLVWIRYGQEVEFHTEAYPGEIFKGKIAFIDPVLNAKTRTVKVRVNLKNLEGKLKPGMFVRATVRANVARSGKVLDPSMAGKWICPMHPEIVKDTAGGCDTCGMPLVRAESLGFIAADSGKQEAPLVIPASAPLITGKRAVVYIAVPDKAGVFEGRDVVLGPRAGDYYLVREGLEEGERVVIKGNFKIDSEIQLAAKPSMMSPEGGGMVGHHHHGASPRKPVKSGKKQKKPFEVSKKFRLQLDGVLDGYFKTQYALSHDDFEGAQEAAGSLLEALDEVDMSLLTGDAHMAWMKELASIKKSAESLESAAGIVKAREAFYSLSESLAIAAKKFGTSGRQPVLRYHCPMAFSDIGVYWLQNKEGTENPYFGSEMFTCGKLVEVITPASENKEPGGRKDE